MARSVLPGANGHVPAAPGLVKPGTYWRTGRATHKRRTIRRSGEDTAPRVCYPTAGKYSTPIGERFAAKHVDEERLETDLQYRFGYVAEFMGFNPKDIEVIHGAAPLLAPLVPTLVDAVYDKLRTYDAT